MNTIFDTNNSQELMMSVEANFVKRGSKLFLKF